MDNNPLTPTPILHKKNTLSKKLAKLIKQQQNTPIQKNIEPGKLQIRQSQKCRARVVNFFGDLNTQIFCLDISADDQFVASGCDNGDTRIYHIYEGKLLMLANSSRLGGYPNTGIRWRPGSNRQLTACNSDGTIRWFDREKQMVIGQHHGQIGYLCTDWNCNGDWAVFGNQKYQLQIYDSETKKLTHKFDAGSVQEWQPNHMNRIYSVKGIQKQPNLFYSGGWDSSVRIWDIRVPNVHVRKFYGPLISSQSLDLKGNNLLVGNYANKDIVQIWDFKHGSVIKTIDLEEKDVGGSYCLCAAYAHQSKYNLYAAGLTSLNKVKIFEDDKNVADLCFQAAPLSLHFYQFNNKDFMVVGGVEGTIYVVKVKIVKPE